MSQHILIQSNIRLGNTGLKLERLLHSSLDISDRRNKAIAWHWVCAIAKLRGVSPYSQSRFHNTLSSTKNWLTTTRSGHGRSGYTQRRRERLLSLPWLLKTALQRRRSFWGNRYLARGNPLTPSTLKLEYWLLMTFRWASTKTQWAETGCTSRLME